VWLPSEAVKDSPELHPCQSLSESILHSYSLNVGSLEAPLKKNLMVPLVYPDAGSALVIVGTDGCIVSSKTAWALRFWNI